MSSETDPLEDDLRRGTGLIGAGVHFVCHALEVSFYFAVIGLEGFVVAEKAFRERYVVGEDGLLGGGLGLGFLPLTYCGAVAVINAERLDTVCAAGGVHFFEESPSASEPGGAHGN